MYSGITCKMVFSLISYHQGHKVRMHQILLRCLPLPIYCRLRLTMHFAGILLALGLVTF
jgi:hypothetical protein